MIPDARSGRKEEHPLIVHLTKDTADIFEGGEGKAPVESASRTASTG